MLKTVNKTVERDEENASTFTGYDVEGYAELDGTSIWDYDYAKHGMRVNVTHIGVTEDDEGYRSIYVTHDAGWQIYTDRGFEASISSVLGFDVTFTEQGMQDDELASME